MAHGGMHRSPRYLEKAWNSEGHGGKSLELQSSRRKFRLRMKLPQKLSSPGAAWLLDL